MHVIYYEQDDPSFTGYVKAEWTWALSGDQDSHLGAVGYPRVSLA